jgi:uncharacterized protein YuzE
MKLHYYPETDSLYIELKAGPGAETREIVGGLLVDLDPDGNVVGSAMHPESSISGRDHCSASSARRGVTRALWGPAMAGKRK